VHLGLEAILINYTNDVVIAVFELRTLLIVLQMCGIFFRQIVLIFSVHVRYMLSPMSVVCRLSVVCNVRAPY